MADGDRTRTRVRSTIDALPPDDKGYLELLLSDVNNTYDDIVASLAERGYTVSRSAVGRYALRYNNTMAKLRQASEQTKALIQSVSEHKNLEATEVASAIMMDGLIRRLATADEEYDSLPLDKVMRIVTQFQRSEVYKERMVKERSKLIASIESNLMRRLQAELPTKDPELLSRLQAIVSEVSREEATRDAAQDT